MMALLSLSLRVGKKFARGVFKAGDLYGDPLRECNRQESWRNQLLIRTCQRPAPRRRTEGLFKFRAIKWTYFKLCRFSASLRSYNRHRLALLLKRSFAVQMKPLQQGIVLIIFLQVPTSIPRVSLTTDALGNCRKNCSSFKILLSMEAHVRSDS